MGRDFDSKFESHTYETFSYFVILLFNKSIILNKTLQITPMKEANIKIKQVVGVNAP
jgi:hypothetical protein